MYHIGKISSLESGAFIYFIRKYKYMYIGETSRIPVMRWAEHVKENGSFSKKLLKNDNEVYYNNKLPISFTCFYCKTVIENSKEALLNRNTKALEHILHVKFFSDKDLVKQFTLISETTRTAPTIYQQRDSWLYDISEKILYDIKLQFINSHYS